MSVRTTLYKIPVLGSLVYFPWRVHKEGMKKFTVLWIFSSLPLVFAVLFSAVPKDSNDIWSSFFSDLFSAITISELFVYSASFIAPLLYIGLSRYWSYEDGSDNEFAKKISQVKGSLFKGYSFLFLIGIIVIILTGMVFASEKTDAEFLKNTYVFHIVSTYSIVFYIFALSCWYLTMLDDIHSISGYEETSKESSKKVQQGLSERIRNRGSS